MNDILKFASYYLLVCPMYFVINNSLFLKRNFCIFGLLIPVIHAKELTLDSIVPSVFK